MGVLKGGAVIGVNEQRASSYDFSRYNAIKHGLTAKTPVLPGEDPAALQAVIDGFKASVQTKNMLEESLVEMAAKCMWRANRAERLEVNRATLDIVSRWQTDATRAARDVAGLGSRVLFDARGPWQLWPWRDFYLRQPRTKPAGEAEDPIKLSDLVIQLEATREGRRWLLREWSEIRKPLEAGGGWLPCQKFKAIRLLGREPIDSVHDDEVALVFLATHAIAPEYFSAFDELKCDIPEDRLEDHLAQLERDERKAITPADEEAGRAALLAIVDKAIGRLRGLEDESAEVTDFVEKLQSETVSAAETKRAEQVERHFGDCNRLMTRNIDAFHRLRRNEVEGWGIVRQERERKREEARRKRAMGPDPRLVMDARGTVRNAEGYRWNLHEGLARYKANIGRQPCEFDEGWSESPWNDARDREDHDGGSTQAEALGALGGQQGGPPEDGGPVPVSVGMRADYQGESAGVGVINCVPVQSTGKGDAANLQNGMLCQLSVVSGQLSGEGVGGRLVGGDDLGAGEPRGTEIGHGGGQEETCGRAEMRDGAMDSERARLIDSVPLTLTGQEPATKTQNDFISDERGRILSDGPIENLEVGQPERGETGCDEDFFGEDPPGRLPEEGCVVVPPPAPERVSKRERRRRRREMSRKEHERRRGATQKAPEVPLDEMLDSVDWMLPNSVAFLRKHMPRSP